MSTDRVLHASAVAREGEAVLLIGPSGSGKSELALRLLARGFDLVADDQVVLRDGFVSAPPSLAGLLETRGLGITRLPYVAQARLALVVRIGEPVERLPLPRWEAGFAAPVIGLDPAAPAAVERVSLALDCALGRLTQVAGAFAP
jgi:HPr kinase/phosphorylase